MLYQDYDSCCPAVSHSGYISTQTDIGLDQPSQRGQHVSTEMHLSARACKQGPLSCAHIALLRHAVSSTTALVDSLFAYLWDQ